MDTQQNNQAERMKPDKNKVHALCPSGAYNSRNYKLICSDRKETNVWERKGQRG